MSLPKRQTSFTLQQPDKRAKVSDVRKKYDDLDYLFQVRKDMELGWFDIVTVVACRHDPNASISVDGAADRSAARAKASKAASLHSADDDSEDEDASAGGSMGEDDEEPYEEDEYEESDEEPGKVGTVVGRLMRRHEIRATFWTDMEEPSQDTAALAFDLFDRYGCLREEFISGSRKGSAIWNHEVDTGNMLQIETIHVEPEFRRQGVASTMLRVLLEEVQKVDDKLRFAFAWPTFLNPSMPRGLTEEEESKLSSQGEATAITLFRKQGFRRVGSSCWFAYATKVDHPSHGLAFTEDFDPPAIPVALTELERLQMDLERSRTIRQHGFMTIVMSDQFQGYPDADVKRLLKLRGIPDTAQTPEVFARAKYGCTCGECAGGYVSPRMTLQLTTQAELDFDMNEMDEDGSMWQDDLELFLPSSWKYLPQSVKPYMKSNKSNREGHRQIYNHILTTLRAGQAPSIPNILHAVDEASEWPPHTKNYLTRAGPVPGTEAVLRGLFDCVKEKDLYAGGVIDNIAAHDEETVDERNTRVDEMVESFRKMRAEMAANGMTAAETAEGAASREGVARVVDEEAESKSLRRHAEKMADMFHEDVMIDVAPLLELKKCRNDGEFGFVLGLLIGKKHVYGTAAEYSG